MVYKLFVWQVGDKYLAVFPEIDPEMIIYGDTKEEIKKELISRATSLLKAMETLPENKDLKELLSIMDTLPDNDLLSVSGINF